MGEWFVCNQRVAQKLMYSFDRAQAAIALRMRLNEAIEDLDKTRLARIEAEQKLQQAERELIISKSNCEALCSPIERAMLTITAPSGSC